MPVATILGGCGSSELARQRAEVASLREKVAKLRDEVDTLQALVRGEDKPVAAPKRTGRRVTVIGQTARGTRITVTAAGILVNGRQVTIETLRRFVEQLANQNPAAAVTVMASKRVPRTRVDEIVTDLRDSGLKRVKLVIR